MSWLNLELKRAFYYSEQVVRILLLNVPLAFRLVPEFNGFSKWALSYLNLQVLGFVWAVLINASFAMACRITYILPDIRWSAEFSSFYMDTDRNFSVRVTSQVLFAFYVQYASLKVVATFGLNVLHVALLSMTPIRLKGTAAADSAFISTMMPLLKIMLQLSYLPSFIVCAGLLSADSVCLNFDSSSTTAGFGSILSLDIASGILYFQNHIRSLLCTRVGLAYLTSPNTQLRRAILFVAVVLLINNVQAFLYVFTNWGELAADRRRLSVRSSTLFQVGAILLCAVSLLSLPMVLGFNYLPTLTGAGTMTGETLVCALALVWAVWLYAFVPVLTDGFRWLQSMDNKKGHSVVVVAAAHVASIVRLSQVLAFACLFLYTLCTRGLLQAQLDLTFVTFLLPGFICTVYTIGTKLVRILAWAKTPVKLAICLVLCAFTAWVITSKLAGSDSKGGLLFVFLHLVIKLSSLVEEEYEEYEEHEEARTPQRKAAAAADVVMQQKIMQAGVGVQGSMLFPADSVDGESESEREGDESAAITANSATDACASSAGIRKGSPSQSRGLATVSEAEVEAD
jgi:hypothetical protein